MLAARLAFLLLLTGLPLVVSFTWGADPLAPKQALWLIGGALLLCAPGPLDLRRAWPVAGVLAVAAAGCLRTGAPPQPLAPWLIGAILYLRARDWGSTPAFVTRALRWSVAVATLVAVNGLLQAVWNRFFTDVRLVNPFGVRVLSTLGNPTFLGDYLALHLPLALHLATGESSPRWRRFAVPAALLIGVIMVLSGSKGGMLAAGAGVAVWAAGGALRGALSPRLLMTGATGTLLAGGIAVALLPGGLEALARWTSAADRFSFSQRWLMLGGSAALVARSPLIGHGTGSYPVLFPSVQPPALGRELGVALSVNHAHLDYLEIAADLGIPALLLIGWVLLSGVRRWREPGPPGALAASQTAAAVSMATNFFLFLPSSAVFAWIHAGFLSASGESSPAPDPGRPSLPRRVGFLLAAFLALTAGRTMLATADLHYAMEAIENRRDGITSEPRLLRAIAMTPANRHAWQFLGRAREIRDELDGSLEAYEQALRLGPHHAITWLNVGRIERQRYLAHRILRHGSRARAIAALRRCVGANPYALEPRIWGGDLAVGAGRGDEAHAFFGVHPPDMSVSSGWHRARQRWLTALGNTRAAGLEGAKADELEAREALAPAEDALRHGRHDEAGRIAAEVGRRWPRFAPAWELLGFVRHQLGDATGARAAFIRLGELLPDSLTAQLNLAVLAINARQPDAAERYLRRAAAIAPDAPEVHLGLARLRASQGRRTDAIAAYERCLQLRPDHPEAAAEQQRLRSVP